MNNKEVIKYIKNQKVDRGITTKEFAGLLGVSLSLMQQIESGTKSPSKEFIVKLKKFDKYLDVNIFF